ncbi:hypothetical protein LX36DRAFT_717325 [Colletotrichum falcatum]|nr:hypothetical protein LX36DRAFT_717325 [Colletotrichum falcatum]
MDEYPEYGNHRDDPAERRHIIPDYSLIAYLAQRINPRLWGEITIKDILEGIPTAQRRRALDTIAISFIADILRDDPVGPGLWHALKMDFYGWKVEDYKNLHHSVLRTLY